MGLRLITSGYRLWVVMVCFGWLQVDMGYVGYGWLLVVTGGCGWLQVGRDDLQ